MEAFFYFDDLVTRKISHVQVKGEGVITSILNDDTIGHRHQRFVLQLAPQKTVLVLNNIDTAPRLENLYLGDKVAFYGEYIWNRHGGCIHRTHPDPAGKFADGYVKLMTDDNQSSELPFPLGVYRHFKGNLYELEGFAKHSETLEDMVIYKALYGEWRTWVRPLAMWDTPVMHNGKMLNRFELVCPANTHKDDD